MFSFGCFLFFDFFLNLCAVFLNLWNFLELGDDVFSLDFFVTVVIGR